MAYNGIRLTKRIPHRKCVSLLILSLPSLLPVDLVVDLVVVKPGILHQLHLGALRTDDVVAVGDEATSDQRSFAARADEAIVMPVPVLE